MCMGLKDLTTGWDAATNEALSWPADANIHVPPRPPSETVRLKDDEPVYFALSETLGHDQARDAVRIIEAKNPDAVRACQGKTRAEALDILKAAEEPPAEAKAA